MQPISEPEARRFLEQASVAHVGVIADGEPYVTPLSFVVDQDRVLFRIMPGKRLSAIEENPAISIEVSRLDEVSGEWVSVVVKGTARVATDDATAQLVLGKLFEKYRHILGSPLSRGGLQPLASLPHVVVAEIEEISGVSSSGLLSGRTRPGRL